MLKILVIKNSMKLKFSSKIKPVFIKDLNNVLKILSLKKFDAILFDYLFKDKNLFKLISSIKKYRNLNNISVIGIINKKFKKEEIKNIILNGVDKIIYYPFKEFNLIRKIREIKNLYKNIFIEYQSKDIITFKIDDNISFLYKINNLISILLYYYDLKPDDIYNLKFTLYEIGTNAIKYRGDCKNPITITISLLEDKIIFKIKDLGNGFDIKKLKSLINEEKLKKLNDINASHGLGIFYSSKIMNRIIYNTKGNYVIMEKFL